MIFNALYHFNWKLNSLWICCHVKHNHPGCEGQPDPEGRFAPKRLLDQRRRRRGLRDDPWPGWLFREAKKREDNGLRSHLEATNILQKLFSGRASDPEGGRQVHDGHWTVSLEREKGFRWIGSDMQRRKTCRDTWIQRATPITKHVTAARPGPSL